MSSMLSGTYNHTIDAKNRMFLPSRMREQLGESVVITKSIDKCLAVYTQSEWDVLYGRLNALPQTEARVIKRFILANAVEAPIDVQGRVLLTQNLKEYAGLEKNVVVIGVGDHAEIWDEQLWGEHETSENAEDVAAMMIKLGF